MSDTEIAHSDPDEFDRIEGGGIHAFMIRPERFGARMGKTGRRYDRVRLRSAKCRVRPWDAQRRAVA